MERLKFFRPDGMEDGKKFLQYLAFLKQECGLYSDIEIDKYPGIVVDENGCYLVDKLDKPSINKFLSELSLKKESPKLTVTKEQEESLRDSLKLYNLSKINQLSTLNGNLRKDIEHYTREITYKFQTMADNYKAIADLSRENFVANIIDEIGKVVEKGFWKFEGVYNGYITFITNENVSLFYSDVEDGINQTLVMSKYKLVITFPSISTKVTPVEDIMSKAVRFDGYYHPHIYDGKLCLGNMIGQFEQAIKDRDLRKIAHITRSILTTYNAGNPYVRFSDLKGEYDKVERLKLGVINEQAAKEAYKQNQTEFPWEDDEYVA